MSFEFIDPLSYWAMFHGPAKNGHFRLCSSQLCIQTISILNLSTLTMAEIIGHAGVRKFWFSLALWTFFYVWSHNSYTKCHEPESKLKKKKIILD